MPAGWKNGWTPRKRSKTPLERSQRDVGIHTVMIDHHRGIRYPHFTRDESKTVYLDFNGAAPKRRTVKVETQFTKSDLALKEGMLQVLDFLAPQVGLEPTTLRLTGEFLAFARRCTTSHRY